MVLPDAPPDAVMLMAEVAEIVEFEFSVTLPFTLIVTELLAVPEAVIFEPELSVKLPAALIQTDPSVASRIVLPFVAAPMITLLAALSVISPSVASSSAAVTVMLLSVTTSFNAVHVMLDPTIASEMVMGQSEVMLTAPPAFIPFVSEPLTAATVSEPMLSSQMLPLPLA